MKTAMELDEDEVKMILEHRADIKEQKFKEVKQALCEHNWVWVCSMHNDDAYDCIKCGATKFE